jgi:uncharacterized protein YbjT (DUF2867 family)
VNPVFVTGGTGYLGKPLIETLLTRGHEVHALVRPGSESKLPSDAQAVQGNALDAASYADRVPAGAAFVHLVGTPHPSPAKAAEFLSVDLASIEASTVAASSARAAHIVYVSVAHPAPAMKAYVAARIAGEARVAAAGIPATILRPWYVLGPGHRWPYTLLPLYALLEAVPATRDGARRLGLVTRTAMVAALLDAVLHPPASGVRTIEVPEIRRLGAL